MSLMRWRSAKYLAAAIFFVMSGAAAETGTSGSSQAVKPMISGPAVHPQISAALRTLPRAIVTPEMLKHPLTPPEEKVPLPRWVTKGHVVDPVLQTKSGHSPNFSELKAKTSAPKFSGIAANGWYPPDPNIAVGPDHIVQVINGGSNGVLIAVFDKSGNAYSGFPKDARLLLGNSCLYALVDPVIQYDKAANRWLLAVMGGTFTNTSNQECVAVSQTSDPTGSWWVYIYSENSDLHDYPKWGVWPTASNSSYLHSANVFEGGGGFHVQISVHNRTAMLSGGTDNWQYVNITDSGSYLPSDVDGSTPPPDGSPGYFMDWYNNSPGTLELYKLSPNFSGTGSYTFGSISVADFTYAGNLIPQFGTSQGLDALGDRLMYRLAYRNFGDHESMVVDHVVGAGGGYGMRWYELRNSNLGSPGNFSLYQQGTWAPDSNYRWVGSIAMDKLGDMILGYSVSGSSLYPSVRLTYRTPSDPLGQMDGELTQSGIPGSFAVEGGGSQTGADRWGDYTSMRIDPSDDCTFWDTDEYYTTSSFSSFATIIGGAYFSACTGGGGGPDFTISPSPTSLTVARNASGTVTLTVTSVNSFAGKVAFSISGLPAKAKGSFSPKSLKLTANAVLTSTLTLKINKKSPTGLYTVTITATSGSTTHSTTVGLTVT